MLRLTELRLPLDHAEGEIESAILKRLKIKPQDLVRYAVFRRAADARKRSAITLIYTLDVRGRERSRAAQALRRRPHVRLRPTSTTASSRARRQAPRTRPDRHRHRPVRPLRRAAARADGIPSDHPGARQGRARAHQGHLGLVAQVGAQSGIERAVRRRRRRHVLRRQAVQPDQGSAPSTAARC